MTNLEEQIIERIADRPKATDELVSSGCTLLDCLAGGGLPFGKMINIVGPESSSKSLLTTEILVNAKNALGEGLRHVYDDVEAGYTFDTNYMYGTQIIDPDFKCSSTVEDFMHNFDNALESLGEDEHLIYVIDSLDALSCQKDIDHAEERNKILASGKKYDKGSYGMFKQKLLSEFFRLYAQKIRDKKCMLIIVSQVRYNVSAVMGMGRKWSRSGGKALDFYSSLSVWLLVKDKDVKTINSQKITRGESIEAEIRKGKIGSSYIKKVHFEVLYDYGIDNITSNLVYLLDLRTDTGRRKATSKKKIELEALKFVNYPDPTIGFTELVDLIEEKGLEDQLSKAVKIKWDMLIERAKPKRKKRFV